MTTKIQVVFYSMYGHIHQLAEAVAAGAREVAGSEVTLYQVAELMPDETLWIHLDYLEPNDENEEGRTYTCTF